MLIKAEINKDNAKSAVTGFVNLFTVLLKLINNAKINKDVIRGSKGIRIVVLVKYPTNKISNYIKILYYFDALFY